METKPLARGLLIAIEGIDGAGKTTQAKALQAHLVSQGHDCVYLREPTDGPIGRQIRALAVKGRHRNDPMEELRLFIEDRRENVARHIRPVLERRGIVVIDRYYYSTICYQGALGIDPEFIRRENEAFAPRPDLVLYLKVPVEAGTSRITNERGDRLTLFEHREYLEKVKRNFDNLKNHCVHTIDASRDSATVRQEVLAAVDKLLASADK